MIRYHQSPPYCGQSDAPEHCGHRVVVRAKNESANGGQRYCSRSFRCHPSPEACTRGIDLVPIVGRLFDSSAPRFLSRESPSRHRNRNDLELRCQQPARAIGSGVAFFRTPTALGKSMAAGRFRRFECEPREPVRRTCERPEFTSEKVWPSGLHGRCAPVLANPCRPTRGWISGLRDFFRSCAECTIFQPVEGDAARCTDGAPHIHANCSNDCWVTIGLASS